MGSSVDVCTLGELMISFDRVRQPVKESDRRHGPFPYYGASGIVDNVDQYLFDGNYLLVAEDGENLRTRQTPIAFMATGKFWVNNHAHVLQANSKGDTRYLMYALRVADVSAFLTGSTMPKLTAGNLARIPIPFRPLNEQRAIASVLGALDEKIELNCKMSVTLEAITRALFKSWFVDFEPVRAKAEGRNPGLSPDITALFPSSFHLVGGSKVPETWIAVTVGDVFRATMGQSPPGDTYNQKQQGIPFYQGRADFDFRFPRRRVYCKEPTRYANAGDTLLSVRAPVGDINLAIETCAIGRGVAALRHRSGSSSYTYYATWFLKEALETYNGEGTVFGSISKADLSGIQVLEPPAELVSTFDRISGPFDTRVRLCQQEMAVLSALRDALLPKLISGELRVADADRILAASA